jgi:hypothetical protein
MPGKNGLETLKNVRGPGNLNWIPFGFTLFPVSYSALGTVFSWQRGQRINWIV